MELKTRVMIRNILLTVLFALQVGALFSVETENLQIPFIENCGQINSNVKYYANTFYGTTYVLDNGEIAHSLIRNNNGEMQNQSFTEKIVNGNVNKIIGNIPGKSKINYFKGENAANYHTNIKSFYSVLFPDIYSGIDMELKAYGNNTEKLFIISPQADPNSIEVELSGIDQLKSSSTGELVLESEKGKTSFTKPIAFQLINGEKEFIEVAYNIRHNSYGFSVGQYDPNYELIIDPLIASTFVGGNSTDEDYQPNLAIDSEGNVFVTGNTYSTESSFQMLETGYDTDHAGQSDRFIYKFSNDLSTLLAATYIGGSSEERGPAICIDNDDNVYIGGYTRSINDFPVITGCYDVTHNGIDDAYVAKFNNDLNDLLACTFFGGSGEEGLYWPRLDMKINSQGHVYIAGNTISSDLPTVTDGTYDATLNGGSDSFLACFDADLTTLLGSTYLGGNADEWWVSIDFDSNDNVFICGGTPSSNFPVTSGAFNTVFNNCNEGCADVYITKFSSNLNSIISSTFLGSYGDEWASSMKIKNDEIFLSGYAGSYFSSLMTENSYSKVFGGGYIDGFVARLDNDLSNLLACTFIGGSSDETSSYLILGENDDIYVCGKTESANLLPFPFNKIAYDATYNGGTDAYLFRMDDDLTTVKAATFLGGNQEDRLQGLAIDDDGFIFAVGRTESHDFPALSNSFDHDYNGGTNDVFISKFDTLLLAEPPYVDFYANVFEIEVDQSVIFTDTSILEYDTYTWDFGEGAEPQTANGAGPHEVIYTTNGQKNISLTVSSSLYGTNTKIKDNYINITAPTGISQLSDNHIDVYPNPTSGLAKIQIPNDCTKCIIRIVNSEGIVMDEIILNKTISNKEISYDFSNFSKGIYYLQGQSSKSTFSKKLIVN